MTSTLEQLAEYVNAHNTSGLTYTANGAAGNILLGYIPDAPGVLDFVCGIFELPSGAPSYVFNSLMPDFEDLMVQFQIRATDYRVSEQAAMAIYSLFSGQTDLVIDGVRYISFLARRRPYLLRRDDRLRTYHVVDFNVRKEPSNEVA